jgi:hypothetical protein
MLMTLAIRAQAHTFDVCPHLQNLNVERPTALAVLVLPNGDGQNQTGPDGCPCSDQCVQIINLHSRSCVHKNLAFHAIPTSETIFRG